MWLVYAISAAIIWGLDYSLGERIFQGKISPYSLLSLQMIVGLIIFTIVSYCTQLKSDLAIISSDPTIFWCVVAAIITFNAGNLLIFLSIQYKNATIAGLIELCYPLFTVLFSLVLFKVNYISPSVIIGALLIFIGVFIISYHS